MYVQLARVTRSAASKQRIVISLKESAESESAPKKRTKTAQLSVKTKNKHLSLLARQ